MGLFLGSKKKNVYCIFANKCLTLNKGYLLISAAPLGIHIEKSTSLYQAPPL